MAYELFAQIVSFHHPEASEPLVDPSWTLPEVMRCAGPATFAFVMLVIGVALLRQRGRRLWGAVSLAASVPSAMFALDQLLEVQKLHDTVESHFDDAHGYENQRYAIEQVVAMLPLGIILGLVALGTIWIVSTRSGTKRRSSGVDLLVLSSLLFITLYVAYECIDPPISTEVLSLASTAWAAPPF